MLFSTRDILIMFGTIFNRDTLYSQERLLRLQPLKTPSKKGGKNKIRHYSEEDVRKLSLAAQAYSMGLKPESVAEIIENPEKLRNESQLSMGNGTSRVLEELVYGTEDSFWTAIGHLGLAQLGCESLAVFTFAPENPTCLKTLRCTRHDIAWERRFVSGRDVARLEAWKHEVATSKSPIAYYGEDLGGELFAESDALYPIRPPTAKIFSVMAVPIWYNATSLRGWVVAANRLDTMDRSGMGFHFDAASKAVGTVFARFISTATDLFLRTNSSRCLLSAARQKNGLGAFFQEVLNYAVPLTRAYRGDVVWLDRTTGCAAIISTLGETRIEPDTPMPRRSVWRRVLETGRPRLIANVHEDSDYFQCNSKTNSELCVPVLSLTDKHPIGAINLESILLNGFDLHSQELLTEIAEFAAFFGQSIENSQMIVARMSGSPRPNTHGSDQNPALHKLLKEVETELGLDRGIVYRADYRTAQLRCAAVNGCSPKDRNYHDFAFSLDEPSLATEVFHSRRPRFVERAEDDLHVNARGVEFFGIRGRAVGVPLLFGPTVMGVMVLWSSHGNAPVMAQELQLMQFANFAVTSLEVAQVEEVRQQQLQQHEAELKAIRSILAFMAVEPPNRILRRVLEALVDLSFDHARVFELDERKRAFCCVDSKSKVDDGQSYVGKRVEVARSFYAQRVMELHPANWHARIYDPKVTLQEDPYAADLGKPRDLPFAISPLFVNNVLRGYLACDNRFSERQISEQNLESLDVFAALAAQALTVPAVENPNISAAKKQGDSGEFYRGHGGPVRKS